MPSIDFEKIIEVARLGINRASVFMGFGVNSARDNGFKNYDLTSETKIKIVPTTEDDEVIKHYKEEYECWVIANGFREVIETFSIFLEEIHKACLTLAWSKGRYTPDKCDGMQSNFHNAGLPDKFNILENRFGIICEEKDHVLSINQTRNCLTHRNGRVGDKDIDASGKLNLSWKDLEILVVPTGEEPTAVTNMPKEGIPTPNGGHIESHYVIRKKSFTKGEYIKFSPRQLAEICWFINQTAIQISNSAVEFACSIGIEIRNRNELNNGQLDANIPRA